MPALGVSVALPMARGVKYALGPELLSNGGFDTDTVWVKGTGWTIASGVGTATVPAVNSLLSQAISLTAGSLYLLTYTVTSYTAGLLTPRFTNAGATVNNFTGAVAVGTYSQYLTLTGAADALSFNANASGSFSIDNVSLKKIL